MLFSDRAAELLLEEFGAVPNLKQLVECADDLAQQLCDDEAIAEIENEFMKSGFGDGETLQRLKTIVLTWALKDNLIATFRGEIAGADTVHLLYIAEQLFGGTLEYDCDWSLVDALRSAIANREPAEV